MSHPVDNIPDTHGHAKGEHRPYASERPISYTARMLFLWFYHAAKRGFPRDLMVTDHTNFLCAEDPAAVKAARDAMSQAQEGDVQAAAAMADVSLDQAQTVGQGLRSGMRFSIGAEIDNDPRNSAMLSEMLGAFEPDGVVRSVHFITIEHPQHGGIFAWPFDNPEFADLHDILGAARTWELYMRELLEVLQKRRGEIVAHFYVPAIFGHWPADQVLRDYEDQLLDVCARQGSAVELNTRFLYRDHPEEEKARYLVEYERLLKKAVAKNVGIAVASDAHSPADQGLAFQRVVPLLNRAGVTELVFPVGGKLTGVPRASVR